VLPLQRNSSPNRGSSLQSPSSHRSCPQPVPLTASPRIKTVAAHHQRALQLCRAAHHLSQLTKPPFLVYTFN
jgi:hypothetical protein